MRKPKPALHRWGRLNREQHGCYFRLFAKLAIGGWTGVGVLPLLLLLAVEVGRKVRLPVGVLESRYVHAVGEQSILEISRAGRQSRGVCMRS
jgi:hypothetical protein